MARPLEIQPDVGVAVFEVSLLRAEDTGVLAVVGAREAEHCVINRRLEIGVHACVHVCEYACAFEWHVCMHAYLRGQSPAGSNCALRRSSVGRAVLLPARQSHRAEIASAQEPRWGIWQVAGQVTDSAW